MRFPLRGPTTALVLLTLTACASVPAPPRTSADALVGAWRSSVQFESGAFASVKDMEFLYVLNAGGTMTESSNYDGAPPGPPAYGIWRQVGAGEYEAQYEFYSTAAPQDLSDLTMGGGWMPAGRGVLTERLTIAGDGRSFSSRIHFVAFDRLWNAGGGEATGQGKRIGF